MRVLIVDNGGLYPSQAEFVTCPRTRDFVHHSSEHYDDTIFMAASFTKQTAKPVGVPLDARLVRVVPVPIRGRGRWSKSLSYCRSLGLIARTVCAADFLYVFFPGNVSLLAVAAARLLRRPYGVYLRGQIGSDSRVWRWVVSGARFVIAHGDVLANAARRYCGNVEQAIPLCPLLPDPDAKLRVARAEGPWRLLYVGRLEERKGTRELIQAASILHRRGVQFQLDLVGHNLLDGLPALVEPFAHSINVVGVIHDDARLRRYYCEADLFCLPSHDEGFPRVLYEAMLYGTPIVTTFVGSIPGLMKDETNCLRVDVGSSCELANTIERALKDPQLRQCLIDNGLATIEPIIRTMREDSHDRQVARKVLQHTKGVARSDLFPGRHAACVGDRCKNT